MHVRLRKPYDASLLELLDGLYDTCKKMGPQRRIQARVHTEESWNIVDSGSKAHVFLSYAFRAANCNVQVMDTSMVLGRSWKYQVKGRRVQADARRHVHMSTSTNGKFQERLFAHSILYICYN